MRYAVARGSERKVPPHRPKPKRSMRLKKLLFTSTPSVRKGMQSAWAAMCMCLVLGDSERKVSPQRRFGPQRSMRLKNFCLHQRHPYMAVRCN